MVEGKERIGIGIITCNRLDYLKELLKSLEQCEGIIDELVIVNDGTPINNFSHLKFPTLNSVWLNNPENIGVGRSKNRAMQHLLDKNCKYIFILEDDIIIKNKDVFETYINTSKQTGIHHFNYGPGSPFNRKQSLTRYDLYNRHLLNADTKPNPKITIDYNSNVKVDLYEHVAGVFSFYTKKVLDEVGLIDEQFYNAWEHVDHTYQIIKSGYHPPFWWFADVNDSERLIGTNPQSITNSTMSKNTDKWLGNVAKNSEIYKNKNGNYPAQTRLASFDEVLLSLKQIKLKSKNI
jgi:GT2 family glycosyltransferase